MRPKPFAIFHPDDATRMGIEAGDAVRLCGNGGEITVNARIGSEGSAGVVLVLSDMPEAPVNRLLDVSGFGSASVQKTSSGAHLEGLPA